ncbi:MAG: PrgI family protein [Patescibacteria group bacterium]|jgi:hypothetical protein
MPRNQFVVPQFLDVEPRIIGPITARQFLIMLTVVLVDFALYRIFIKSIPGILVTALPVTLIGSVFAFGRMNGQPFHVIALNVLQTVRRPAKRVWDKTMSDMDLRVLMKKEEAPPSIVRHTKAPLEQSRLSELTLVVNTGGVYSGEE